MQLKRILNKTVLMAAHMVLARCAMYGEYDFYNGNMYNNFGYNDGQPMQTLDDSYYYGAANNGCESGGCSIQMDSPAIGGNEHYRIPSYDNNSYMSEQPAYISYTPEEPAYTSYTPEQPAHNSYVAMQPAQNSCAAMQPAQNSCVAMQPAQNSYAAMQPAQNSYVAMQPAHNSYASEQLMPMLDNTSAAKVHTISHKNSQELNQINPGDKQAEQQFTVLLNGNIPVEMHPTAITLGEETYPLNTAPAISSSVATHKDSSLSLGNSQITDLDFSQAVITDLPTPTKEQIEEASKISDAAKASAAGTTAAQLKKDQEKKDNAKDNKSRPKSKKKGKAGSGSNEKLALKKKNGVAGISTLVAIAVLPVVALLM